MKTLSIITQGENTCVALKKQLENLLGDRVKIIGYYIDGNLADNIRADLVLVSGLHTYKTALPKINPSCPIILARRSINYHEVDKLFDLPDGCDVLLVNDLPSSVQDTISLLKALGINHINYHPYVPGMHDYPHLKIAITPGEVNLVPPCVEQIIDIKTRVIDITTLTEVLQKLSIIDEETNLLSASYLRDMVKLIKKSKHSSNVSNKIKNQLQTIINTVHDGIIAVDSAGYISVFNPIAEELTGLKAEQVVGRKIDSLSDRNLLAGLTSWQRKTETFVMINNHYVVVNVATIGEQNNELGKVYTFKDVSEIQRLEEELRRNLAEKLHVARYCLSDLRGSSEKVRHTVELANKMSASNAPILIQGESGTGKEVLAQGIHNASPRRNGPFIAVNFAAMTESLLESELFGYEGGAFTGARKGGAPGLFEQAHKGTIFLDEVGDAPLPFQVKLLRVLQEKQVRRVGGSRIIPIDVRVIAATNRDLKELIREKTFRQDLYYRLNVLPIELPPLRERRQDILVLAKDFYKAFTGKQYNAAFAEIYFRDITSILIKYDWPGNIRELQNVVEYLVSISPDQPPNVSLLPEELRIANRQNRQSDHDAKQLILNTINACNQKGRPVGRRSLAMFLSLPESVVRKFVEQLHMEGLIEINKGRRGLVASTTDFR